ncbi:MAG: hypothetical protein ABSC20_08515 [Candidatus Bathyarchaeia archaeon]
MNQKEIEAASVMMRIFLAGLAFNFDANFHELEDPDDYWIFFRTASGLPKIPSHVMFIQTVYFT